MTGIRISRRHTSGRRLRAARPPARRPPLRRRPRCRAGSRGSSGARCARGPGRRRSSTRTVTPSTPPSEGMPLRSIRRSARSGLEGAAEQRRAFPHPRDAEAGRTPDAAPRPSSRASSRAPLSSTLTRRRRAWRRAHGVGRSSRPPGRGGTPRRPRWPAPNRRRPRGRTATGGPFRGKRERRTSRAPGVGASSGARRPAAARRPSRASRGACARLRPRWSAALRPPHPGRSQPPPCPPAPGSRSPRRGGRRCRAGRARAARAPSGEPGRVPEPGPGCATETRGRVCPS